MVTYRAGAHRREVLITKAYAPAETRQAIAGVADRTVITSMVVYA